MGYALAEEFARRGAFVTLISGPVSIQSNHQNISVTNVVSAAEMHNACMSAFPESRIAIMSAAVADYTPTKIHKQKVKKHSEADWEIKLKKTKDILKNMGINKRSDQVLVGFALETDNELDNAFHKLENKNLDLIVLNSLMDKGAGFGGTTNKVTFIDKNKKTENFSLKSKTEVAADIANKVKLLLSS
jgi:phosphopantothenoylcysteine decarboxylase/phosphopantothenate--cysteine ligase